jgi:predicted esterase
MHFLTAKKCFALCFFLLQFLAASSVLSQHKTDSLLFYWHKAYFDDIHNDPQASIQSYKKVSEFCESEPQHIRQWYKGESFLGIALTNLRFGNIPDTKDAVSKALSYHFWNFNLVHLLFDSACGKNWVDSLCNFWNEVRHKEMPSWESQPVIIMKPKNFSTWTQYPLIIALHGGNDSYERFASRLRSLADSLNAIVAIPAGCCRISESMNSWEDDTTFGIKEIADLIKTLTKNYTIDTNTISLLGYSQGAQMCYEYGFAHPEHIQNIITFAGFAPGKVDSEKLRNTALHHVKVIAISGELDYSQFLSSTHNLETMARQEGVDFQIRTEKKLPHGMPLHASRYCSDLWKELHGMPIPKREHKDSKCRTKHRNLHLINN